MRLRTLSLAVLMAAFVVMTAPAWAQDACQSVAGNFVTNCGFETGNFYGWTESGNTSFMGVTGSPAYVDSGNYGAFLGPVGSDGYLSTFVGSNSLSFQNRQDPGFWGLDSVEVVLVGPCGAGCDTYYVQFALYNTGGIPNDFTVLWNGIDVGPDLVNSDAFPYTVVSGYLNGSAVPEPGSLVLLGTGLMGVAGAVRRRLIG